MRAASKSFRAVFFLLWLRLITISVIGLLFAAPLLHPPSMVAGWFYYLTTWEVLFELTVRITTVALGGAALGTIMAILVAPFLRQEAFRDDLAEKVTRAAVVVAAFGAFGIIVRALFEWAGLIPMPAVLAGYCAAFAVALWRPRTREQLMGSLDHFLGEKTVRRTALAIAIATAALAGGERLMMTPATTAAKATPAVRPSGPNILLITFDALSAEDMSLYGYRLPTTPHIEEFARKSSVFTSFFSASTFTTPGVATILTGLYPSENHIYHLQGRLSKADVAKSLPHLLRAGNYATGAAVSNPWAYFFASQLAADYDLLPGPSYRLGAFTNVWNATQLLHQPLPFGSRSDEFKNYEHTWDFLPASLERYSPQRFGRLQSGSPPSATFAQAEELLTQMPDGFFLWVHVLAPHGPYLPGPGYAGRFLPTDEMRTAEQQDILSGWQRYEPELQHRVDQARLRYDEFVAEADGALGAFLDKLEGAGKLRDTAVILSADHGESFEGGLYNHNSKYQTRPEIHIPLIIRMPGQEHGSRIAVAADQTSLSRTILDIARLPKPDWIRGTSLLSWLNRDNQGQGEGLAFTQYLATNSIFKPLNSGTVGVIDGHDQYVLDLATGKARMRSLAEAQLCDLDRSAENPVLAQKLREAIYSRFPDLPRKPQ